MVAEAFRIARQLDFSGLAFSAEEPAEDSEAADSGSVAEGDLVAGGAFESGDRFPEVLHQRFLENCE